MQNASKSTISRGNLLSDSAEDRTALETPSAPVAETAEPQTYLKALPLRDITDLEEIKNELKSGHILVIRITPLAKKSLEDVKKAINELCDFVASLGGDIARLGEERVVITPAPIKIWRKTTPETQTAMQQQSSEATVT